MLSINYDKKSVKKTKLIPEHNQKQKFSSVMQAIIDNKKRKAEELFEYKKATLFESNLNIEGINKKRSYGISFSYKDYKYYKRNLNIVISKKEANQIKIDSCKQYMKN
jgi:hypothetical protein